VRDHVVTVASIVGDARYLAPLAGKKITTATGLAAPTIPAVPTNADPLALGPTHDASANCVNESGHLMSRNSRILNAGEGPLLYQRVAVADATRLYLDAYLPRSWLWNFSFDKFKGTIRLSHLYDTHLRHIFLPLIYLMMVSNDFVLSTS
jgi:hypothetical protein